MLGFSRLGGVVVEWWWSGSGVVWGTIDRYRAMVVWDSVEFWEVMRRSVGSK